MRLTRRVERLTEQIPEPRRQVNVPTATLVEFVRGLLAGTFAVTDIDRTDHEHMSMLSLFGVTLVTLSPAHQAYCDENPWARTQRDAWEREHLLLTPAEMSALRAMAGRMARSSEN